MMNKIATCALLTLFATGAQAATLTGFSTWEDGLVQIDTATGNVTVIGGTYDPGLTNFIQGLAYDSNGVLWGIAASGSANTSIGTIDPSTGEYTLIGTDNVGTLSGAAFTPDDKLYSINTLGGPTDRIAEINKTNAVPTDLVSTGVRVANGFAISGDGLFGYTIDVDGDNLLRYDFNLNTVTSIGQTTAGISALTFHGSTLYATTDKNDGSTDLLLTIDPLTGLELSRVNLSLGVFANISALAAVPDTPAIPIPAGGLLLLSGLGGLCIWRRRVIPT
ncbi:VPLPA-CTERM sorting domain-containing protein [Pseudooceanicola sp.]|uniref:VPLPA-CTERM sorting domain-containing protein n=2 Tax=Pseudooceanicola sp. TaxID=1914328 RepID=UPI0035C73529